MTVQPNQLAKIFKALGDENRLRILEMLQGEERCACMLLDEMHITQPTLSHHMKILCDVDLVIGQRRQMDALSLKCGSVSKSSSVFTENS